MAKKTCDWCGSSGPLEWECQACWVTEEDPRTGKVHKGWTELCGWFCSEGKDGLSCWEEHQQARGVEL